MPTCAAVLAATLRDAGIRRLFGLPGGEILDFMEAARVTGLEFLLTRHEATASFMADVTGQIDDVPGVCVATLGPGAVNMTLGIANAFLDRSPVVAITAAHATTAAPYATHQNLDLIAVYRPFTKLALTLDGVDTASKVREAIEVSLAPRRGPVHIALPSDIARAEDRVTGSAPSVVHGRARRLMDQPAALEAVAQAIGAARRPIVILGLDLDPRTHAPAVRAFVERLGAPVFVRRIRRMGLPGRDDGAVGRCRARSAAGRSHRRHRRTRRSDRVPEADVLEAAFTVKEHSQRSLRAEKNILISIERCPAVAPRFARQDGVRVSDHKHGGISVVLVIAHPHTILSPAEGPATRPLRTSLEARPLSALCSLRSLRVLLDSGWHWPEAGERPLSQ